MDDSQVIVTYPSANVLKITTIIGTEKREIDFRTELRINTGNLVKELSEQPGHYAWYSAILADQEDQALSKKRDMERRRSDLALQLRQGKLKISDASGAAIKLTEGAIQDYIENDKLMKAMQDELFTLESYCKKFKILVAASVQRKDMLVNLGLLERQERKQFNS